MNNINKEAKEIALKLSIDHKINCIAKQPGFITIKDHKLNFKTNPLYRLINPTKSKIRKISKHILDNINTQLNQWKNTKAITNWFTAISNKNNTTFIQFYITKHTLDRALELAAQHIPVLQEGIRIFKHCCKSILFHDNKLWIKNLTTNCST